MPLLIFSSELENSYCIWIKHDQLLETGATSQILNSHLMSLDYIGVHKYSISIIFLIC